MHSEALAYIAAHLPAEATDVLEFGSRDINGSPRVLCPGVERYVGIDVADGTGVDICGDAGTEKVPGSRKFDVVICAEVFEHAPDDECEAMCSNAAHHLRKGGLFIATMAGHGREPHSAHDGAELREDEFYRNVTRPKLKHWLEQAGFSSIDLDVAGVDLRCVAVK